MNNDVCAKILNIITEKEKQNDNILFDMDIWDWSQGVALYGVLKYYDLTQDDRYLRYLIDWFDSKIDTDINHTVNTGSPLLVLCYLYEYTKNEKYLDYCKKIADWVINDMPKTEMGGIQHITMDSDNFQQLWADTIFMMVLFMAKIGSITGNKTYTNEAKKQFSLHIRYLADKKTGLWYHGWNFETKSNYAKALWARGNCWFTIAAAEVPEIMELEPWTRDIILDSFRQQVESLGKFQSECGLWHTLIDHDDSYVEVSGSAGFAYGILKGIRMGYLAPEYKTVAKKAVEAICGYINEDGIVGQVSYGTIVADTLDYYKNVSLKPTGYGQNLTLIMLIELLTWKKQGLTL